VSVTQSVIYITTTLTQRWPESHRIKSRLMLFGPTSRRDRNDNKLPIYLQRWPNVGPRVIIEQESVNVVWADVAPRSINNSRLAMMPPLSARASTSGKSQQTLPETLQNLRINSYEAAKFCQSIKGRFKIGNFSFLIWF